MLNEEIMNLISDKNEINELYFIVARSHYLKSGERKGVLSISTKHPTEYLQYLKGEGELPKIKMEYEVDDELSTGFDYNPDSQFHVLLETLTDSEWKVTSAIINKKTPRDVLYSQTISLSGTVFNQEEHIANTPCANCDRVAKVKLENLPYETSNCNCCNKKVFIRYIYECTKCCTQYIYTMQ